MEKSVFITGATVNTGLGIAEKFAKEGYNLFLGSRNAENAEKTAKELSEKYGVYAKGYGMKIFDEENTKEIFKDIKNSGYSVDTLVLNAANLGIRQQFFDVSIDDFMNVINTNIGWNFMLSREAAIQMKENGGGSIVFVNSNTAYRAIPDRIAYSASKSGALGMMRALALDLGILLCVNEEAYGKCEGDDKGKHHACDACCGYYTCCHNHPPCRYTIGVFARPAPGGEQGHSISSSGGRSI